MNAPKSILIPADVSRLARTLDPATGLGTDASHLASSGVGTYLRHVKRREATGVAATDVANIVADLAAVAGTGELTLYGGTFASDTPLRIPSRTSLFLHPAAAFSSTIVPGTAGYLFYARPTYTAAQFALQAAITADAISFTVPTLTNGGETLAVGMDIAIMDSLESNFCTPHEIDAITGAGPYTIFVKRPILYDVALATGYVKIASDPAKAINFIGNGALLSGTGLRAIEMIMTQHCVVDGFRIHSNGGVNAFQIATGLDVGNYKTRFSNVDVDLDQLGQLGFISECNEACDVDRVIVRGRITSGGYATSRGFHTYYGRGNTYSNFVVSGCYYGATLDDISELAPGPGYDCKLTNADLSFNTYGLVVSDYARRWQIDRCSVRKNTLQAIRIVAPAGGTGGKVPNDIKFCDTTVEITTANQNAGIYVGTSCPAKGVKFSRTTIKDSCSSALTFVVAADSACDAEFDGVEYAVTGGAGTHYLFNQTLGAVFKIANVHVTRDAGGSVNLNHQDQTTPCTMIVGENVDASACDTWYAADVAAWGGNQGTFTATGSTGKVISVPARLGLRAGQEYRISLGIYSYGGSPNGIYNVVAGTNQFTVTRVAGDTSLQSWRVL